MRIQTRLFLGTALLVLALMAVQWWLHTRQLRRIEDQLATVATSVGKDILNSVPPFLVGQVDSPRAEGPMWWMPDQPETTPDDALPRFRVLVIPSEDDDVVTHHVERRITRSDSETDGASRYEWSMETEVRAEALDALTELRPASAGEPEADVVRRITLEVVGGDTRMERFLVIGSDAGLLRRIPIPVSDTVASFRSTMHEGAAVGGLLLVLGLVGAGVLSNRMARPLRSLAEGAEAIGRGRLGATVPETAAGEVGELQRAFNHMSRRLADLEQQRQRWLEREHLAQLGDLSRGLAHTLRNPLNTLGLAVEELATGGRDSVRLAATARAQIHRIDRWLRSFLALGAESATEPTRHRLDDLVRAVVLESAQHDALVRLDLPDRPVTVRVVPSAIHAALSNLLENAVQATPTGTAVEVSVSRHGNEALVVIRDHGPGLPEAVRQRLFSPHVTTRPEGSGMGLFLARQLVAGMHDGVLDIADADGEEGTVATIRLPACEDRERADGG